MYVHREVEKVFEKLKGVYNILAIVGARQAGKTTLLKKMLEENNGIYLSMDDPDVKELFDADIKKFEKQYLKPDRIVGIDEIQYGRDAGIKLKYLADKGYRLWTTSSSEIILGKDVLSYLVGRVSIIRLYPFSLEEFMRAKGIEEVTEKIMTRIVWEHMMYGGYPKVVLTEDVELKERILRDLFETTLLKDISKTFSVEDLDTLEKLVRYLATTTGQLISYDTICSTLNISFLTLKKYLDALEKSYIIKRVLPYYTNKTKELYKTPKIYFVDTGIRNMLLKNYPAEVDGRTFENYVFTELLKKGLEVKYWRTKSKAEVDFVLEKKNEIIPVEVKVSMTTPKLSRSMLSFIKTYKPKEAFLVYYKGEKKEIRVGGTKVRFVGVMELLKEICD